MIIIRIWHQKLISYLPRQQLLGQHRECCALRGKGWGRKHATVDYVFKYDPTYLVAYHYLIMEEMRRRNYNPNPVWKIADWRGDELGDCEGWTNFVWATELCLESKKGLIIYPEHNDEYLKECIDNLKSKGIDVSEMEKLL